MISVLVTGASGQLGQSITSISKEYSEIEFVFCNSKELDITNINSIDSVFKRNSGFDYCINCAAYTAVDIAEDEPEIAELINVLGVKNLAEICKMNDTKLIHVSTDFVFDGNSKDPYKEDDKASPISVYGKTKLAGEKILQSILNEHYIVRTSWVYSQFGNNFVKTMLRLSETKHEIGVVSDQIGAPTYAVDLAKVLIKIITFANLKYGIYHFSGNAKISWYNFAVQIFKIKNFNILVNPLKTNEFPTKAVRPIYSVLDNTKIINSLHEEKLDWKARLDLMLNKLREND
jgi:dTDP-4-dehydrorhamnose reductase